MNYILISICKTNSPDFIKGKSSSKQYNTMPLAGVNKMSQNWLKCSTIQWHFTNPAKIKMQPELRPFWQNEWNKNPSKAEYIVSDACTTAHQHQQPPSSSSLHHHSPPDVSSFCLGISSLLVDLTKTLLSPCCPANPRGTTTRQADHLNNLGVTSQPSGYYNHTRHLNNLGVTHNPRGSYYNKTDQLNNTQTAIIT